MKKTLIAIACAAVTAIMCVGLFSGAGAASDDPADTYVKETAASEDSSIDLWFEHSFKKVLTEDKTPSGMNTYSVYMAKNEVENAQFVLYSDTDHTKMKAQVSDFTDANGNTVPAELYYEMYITTSSLDVTSVLGSTSAADSIIRAGETPDPVVPFSSVGSFKLNAGKSQAFFIKLRTSENTPSGWYSARLDILDSNGNQVKTATVFAYVWDFALSEKTALQTSFYVDNKTSYGGSYKAFYDYLLDNRLLGMDVPGTLDSSNEYLTNDRVNAVRVSALNGGNNGVYTDIINNYGKYVNIYNDLSAMDNWSDIKDKLYFYTVDEPMSQERHDFVGATNLETVDDVKERAVALNKFWVDPQIVVPYNDNHPYPYYHYNKYLSTYASKDIRDGMQEMLDTGSVTIWCPQTMGFTPSSALRAQNYSGLDSDKIRNLSCTISGLFAVKQSNGSYAYDAAYFNWEGLYGDFYDRVQSYMSVENAKKADGENPYKLWTYSAGWNKSYTYCNHLIENTGLQTKMLFWQLYQNDITGYLYYGVNHWNEDDANNGSYVDKTVTGAKTNCIWKPNKHPYATGYSIYGNGVLIYGKNQARVGGVDVVGTLRVEIMRDGIEDYQMLTMLSELKGNDAAKAIVAQVSNNVVNYLSLNGFDRSAWSSAMDEYDIMAAVRKGLGNQVEAAAKETACEHDWQNETVTKAAGCITTGTKQYTCTKCGSTKTEIIPAKHTVGDCFTVVTQKAATCETDGSTVYRCTECGYEKTETVKAFHEDRNHYKCESKNATTHNLVCDTCGSIVDTEAHVFLYSYTNTCTEAGEKIQTCRYCGYSETVAEVEAKGHNLTDVRVEPDCGHDGYVGQKCTRCDYLEKTETLAATGKHNYVNGVCSVCGAKEPTPEVKRGDITGDGRINASDLNMLKRILVSVYIPDETESYAADVNGDGRITVSDANYLKRIFVGAV